jgi:hypothetical protein
VETSGRRSRTAVGGQAPARFTNSAPAPVQRGPRPTAPVAGGRGSRPALPSAGPGVYRALGSFPDATGTEAVDVYIHEEEEDDNMSEGSLPDPLINVRAANTGTVPRVQPAAGRRQGEPKQRPSRKLPSMDSTNHAARSWYRAQKQHSLAVSRSHMLADRSQSLYWLQKNVIDMARARKEGLDFPEFELSREDLELLNTSVKDILLSDSDSDN